MQVGTNNAYILSDKEYVDMRLLRPFGARNDERIYTMRKMIGKIGEVVVDIKTGVRMYLLARRYSRKNRGVTSRSVREFFYGQN